MELQHSRFKILQFKETDKDWLLPQTSPVLLQRTGHWYELVSWILCCCLPRASSPDLRFYNRRTTTIDILINTRTVGEDLKTFIVSTTMVLLGFSSPGRWASVADCTKKLKKFTGLYWTIRWDFVNTSAKSKWNKSNKTKMFPFYTSELDVKIRSWDSNRYLSA